MKEKAMIDDSDEMRWLKDQRPPAAPPSAECTGWARASVLFHADRAARLVGLEARREPKRGVLVAAAAAAVAAAGVAMTAIGLPHGGSGLLAGPAPASAAIVTLADKIQNAAPLTGDATLVEHTNANAYGHNTFTGADLYLDDGRYFYAMTPAGLPAAVKGGPEDYSLKAVMDAMGADSGADPQAARAAFLKAVNPYWGDDTENEPTWRQDNVIWCSGIDLLGAAYGRPAVLAAMLRVFSTVDAVTVQRTVYDGHDALQISMKDPGSVAWAKILATTSPVAVPSPTSTDTAVKLAERKQQAEVKASADKTQIPPHLMTLTLDDQTGALLRYTDIGLVVTYHVTRVDAADYGVR
jgi:hypothetical protein